MTPFCITFGGNSTFEVFTELPQKGPRGFDCYRGRALYKNIVKFKKVKYIDFSFPNNSIWLFAIYIIF